MNKLGLLLSETGSVADAVKLLREALELRVRVLPAIHSHVAVSHSNLALALLREGQFVEAADHCEQALDILLKARSKDRSYFGRTCERLLEARRALGAERDARVLVNEVASQLDGRGEHELAAELRGLP
jgi:tetratricopeptide (TPR) repeat protein